MIGHFRTTPESEASSGSISAGFPSVLYFDSGVSSTLSDADDNKSDFESILSLRSYEDEDEDSGGCEDDEDGRDEDGKDEDGGDEDGRDEDEDAGDEKDEDGDVTYTDDIEDEPDMQMDDMRINITLIRKINGVENLLRVDDLCRNGSLKVGITAKHRLLNEDADQSLDAESGSRRQSTNFFILDLGILSSNKISFEYQTIH